MPVQEPPLTPAELEVIIEQMQKQIDVAFEEAYKAGVKYIHKAYEAGWDKGKGDVENAGFGPFNVPPDEEALKFLDGYQFDLIKGLGEDIKKDIGRVVRDAVSNGWSMQRAARELGKILDHKKWRINTIARTEVMRAANMGRLNAYKKSGVVKGKEWLTAFDDRTCPECAACDGDRAPLDKPFRCGVMAPPLHPNCRCTITPIFYNEPLRRGDVPKEFSREDELHMGQLELKYSAALKRAFKAGLDECKKILRRYYR